MPPRPTTLIAAAASALAGIAGLCVWDASRADVIADGVSIGPVDVGGLSRDEARARVQQRLLQPPDPPAAVTAADRTFRLTAHEGRIHANLDVTVDAAIERGRSGGILARTWRAISGQKVGARLRPDIEDSRTPGQQLPRPPP